MRLNEAPDLAKAAYAGWMQHNPARLGAALAFFTVFSLAPLLIIAIAVAGFVFGEEAARGQISIQISATVGPQVAKGIEDMVRNAAKPGQGIIAAAIGVATLILGASGVFGQLKDAMNTIWEVLPDPEGGFLKLIRDRFLTFTMVLGASFLLLVSLIVSAGLAALTNAASGTGIAVSPLFQLLDAVVALGIVTVLFALLFKYLPDVKVAWHDVWLGAFVTSLLFSIGKLVIGLYLGRSGVASAYGAAGSLIVILLWVYYASQILFFGAELTRAYALRHGSQKPPEQDSARPTEADVVQLLRG